VAYVTNANLQDKARMLAVPRMGWCGEDNRGYADVVEMQCLCLRLIGCFLSWDIEGKGFPGAAHEVTVRFAPMLPIFIQHVNSSDMNLRYLAAFVTAFFANSNTGRSYICRLLPASRKGFVHAMSICNSTSDTEPLDDVPMSIPAAGSQTMDSPYQQISRSVQELLYYQQKGSLFIRKHSTLALMRLALSSPAYSDLILSPGVSGFLANSINLIKDHGLVPVYRHVPLDQLKKIGSTIGCGGTSIVHAVSYKNRQYAAKYIQLDSLGVDLPSIYVELAIMSVVRHPCLCPCLGAHVDSNMVVLLAPLFPLGSLESYIFEKDFDLPSKMKLQMAVDIAEACAYLHSVGIVHRDLKPGNCLVVDDFRIKLTDYGTCQAYVKAMQLSKGIGTSIYMAPEVSASNCNSYTEKADVFSFGMILYELDERCPPYKNLSSIDAASRLYNDRVAPTVNPNNFFAKATEHALRMDPSERPSFIQMLSEHLLPIRDDLGLSVLECSLNRRMGLTVPSAEVFTNISSTGGPSVSEIFVDDDEYHPLGISQTSLLQCALSHGESLRDAPHTFSVEATGAADVMMVSSHSMGRSTSRIFRIHPRLFDDRSFE